LAGQPLKQRVRQALADLAKEHIGEEASALDYICQCVESGEQVKAIAERVADLVNEDFGRPWFSTLIHDLEPDAKTRIMAARKASAPALVDEAADILDDAPTHDRVQLEKAKAQSALRIWMAERYGKETYGQQQPVAQVNLNVGSMHLDAFRAIASQNVQNAPSLPAVATIAPIPLSLPSPTDGDTR
jgi:hypothetical protein